MRKRRTGNVCQLVQSGHPSADEVCAGLIAQNARGRFLFILLEKNRLLCGPHWRRKSPDRRSIVHRKSIVTSFAVAPVQRVRGVRTTATGYRRRKPTDSFYRRFRLSNTGPTKPFLRSLRCQVSTYNTVLTEIIIFLYEFVKFNEIYILYIKKKTFILIPKFLLQNMYIREKKNRNVKVNFCFDS